MKSNIKKLDFLPCEKCFFSASKYNFILTVWVKKRFEEEKTWKKVPRHYVFRDFDAKRHLPIYSGLLALHDFDELPDLTLEEALEAMNRSMIIETANYRKKRGEHFAGITWSLVAVTSRRLIYLNGKEETEE